MYTNNGNERDNTATMWPHDPGRSGGGLSYGQLPRTSTPRTTKAAHVATLTCCRSR